MAIKQNEIAPLEPSVEENAAAVPEVSVPETLRLKAPRTLKAGEVIKSNVDGIYFWARVPDGGVKQFETFETAYPKFIMTKAPRDLNGGERFWTVYEDGTKFQATAPKGGCLEGEEFETLHPSVAPPDEKALKKAERRQFLKRLFKLFCCSIFPVLVLLGLIVLIGFLASL